MDESGKRKFEKNAERDSHRFFSKMGLSIPLHINKKVFHADGNSIEAHYLNVSQWLGYFLQNAPSVLAGGRDALEDQLQAFWKMYEWVHPEHHIFSLDASRLRTTIPILIFGDEGKGPKRGNYLITTFETPIGPSQTEPLQCGCCDFVASKAEHVPNCYGPVAQAAELDVASRQSTTVKGGSYLTRHILFGLPDFVYKDYPAVYEGLLNLLAEDLIKLDARGLRVADRQYYGVLLGHKGDLKHMAEKAAKLSRSYANLGSTHEIGICHLCMAGTAGYPFEDSGDVPAWTETLYQGRPWNDDPPLSRSPYDQAAPEMLYKLDLFHLFKVGIGRDVAGSTCLLCRLGYFDYEGSRRNLAHRLCNAHKSFKLWCLAMHKSPGLRYFSPAFFNMKRLSDYAWSNSP